MGKDVLLAVLCTAGLLFAALLLYGWLLRPLPKPGVTCVLPGRGSGEHLEQTLRGLVWLRSLGLLRGTILIANIDLTPEGRELALHLAARWPDVALWPAEDLPDYIRHT